MAAGIYDITCEQGATFQRILTWKDSDGDPINLNGYTAAMQVRDGACGQTKILEATTGNSKIVLGGALGTITITVSATDTAALPVGEFVYDLELNQSGTVTRLIQGSFTVSREVTK
jgi:hypothetical protein